MGIPFSFDKVCLADQICLILSFCALDLNKQECCLIFMTNWLCMVTVHMTKFELKLRDTNVGVT